MSNTDFDPLSVEEPKTTTQFTGGTPEPVESVRRRALGEALGTKMGGSVADLYEREAAAEKRVKLAEAEKDRDLAQRLANAQTAASQGIKARYAAAEPQLMAPPPKFNVTKESAEGMNALAVLLPVAGLIIGSKGMMSGVNAMNAMTGALEGYQKGNKERIEFETKKYEKAMQEWEKTIGQIKDSLARYEKMASLDLASATAQAKAEAAAKGYGIVADIIEKDGISNARALLEKIAIQTKTANDRIQNSALVPVLGLDGKPMLVTRQQANDAAQAGTPYTPAPRSTTAGQNALTFASRVYGNIENASQDLINLANSPLTAQAPVFSGIINSDPTTVAGSLQALALRNATPEEERVFDQLSQQVGLALSRLEAQGLASGSTQAQVKGFDALRPKAGDNAINMAMYLAKVRQEIETGVKVHSAMQGATPEQKANAQQRLQEIRRAIPFTVDDVQAVLRGQNKTLSESMQKLVNQPGVATGLQPTQDQSGGGSQQKTINPKAIEMLKKDPSPEKRKQFDEIFGAGSAARILGE